MDSFWNRKNQVHQYQRIKRRSNSMEKNLVPLSSNPQKWNRKFHPMIMLIVLISSCVLWNFCIFIVQWNSITSKSIKLQTISQNYGIKPSILSNLINMNNTETLKKSTIQSKHSTDSIEHPKVQEKNSKSPTVESKKHIVIAVKPSNITIKSKEMTQNKSFVKNINTFQVVSRSKDFHNCSVQPGSCLGVGCDGAVWSGTLICYRPTSREPFRYLKRPIALKLYKNLTHFIDTNQKLDWNLQHRLEKLNQSSMEIQNQLAYTYARVPMNISSIKNSIGECPIIQTYNDSQCPGKLHPYLWKHQFQFVNASIMPYAGKSLGKVQAKKSYRQMAPNIFLGLAKGFQMLYQANIVHCDMQMFHVTASKVVQWDNDFNISNNLTGRIIDFSRIRLCPSNSICEPGHKMNMLQFGSMIVDFCRPKNAPAFPYASSAYANNAAACGYSSRIGSYKEPQRIYEYFRKEWKKRILPHLKQGFGNCPHEKEMSEIAHMAYQPLIRNMTLNWDSIISKLQNLDHMKKNISIQ